MVTTTTRTKKQEDVEVVLAARLLEVVGDEVCCPEAAEGTFNFFFLARSKENNGKRVYHIQVDIPKVYMRGYYLSLVGRISWSEKIKIYQDLRTSERELLRPHP